MMNDSPAWKIGIDGPSSQQSLALVDAVSIQSDMVISIVAGESSWEELASRRGIPWTHSQKELITRCDLFVNTQGPRMNVSRATDPGHLRANENLLSSPATGTAASHSRHHTMILHPDAIGLARILHALAPTCSVRRLAATVLCRPMQRAGHLWAAIDGLTPRPPCDEFKRDLELALPDLDRPATVGIVEAPITHCHLIILRLTLASPIGKPQVLQVLENNSRFLLRSVDDGFRTTADIDEYFRDLQRPGGACWELFVWTDSVTCDADDLFLMAALHADEIVVPETLDAIRQLADCAKDPRSIRNMTNRELFPPAVAYQTPLSYREK